MAAVEERLQSLEAVYRGRDPEAILLYAIREAFPAGLRWFPPSGGCGGVAPPRRERRPGDAGDLLDTNKLFGETVRYRSRLQHHLGLEDVRSSARASEMSKRAIRWARFPCAIPTPAARSGSRSRSPAH
ncbi:MAG: hypothetical protein R3C58_05285 [Parvularculaceae bacterium]